MKSVKIPNKTHFFMKNDNRINIIENLSKINIFVGENNSGKSRLLRNVLYYRIEYEPNWFSLEKLNETLQLLIDDIRNYYSKKGLEIHPAISQALPKIQSVYPEDLNYFDPISKLKAIIEEFQNHTNQEINGHSLSKIGTDLMKIFDNRLAELPPEVNNEDSSLFFRIYIPVIRGLIPLYATNEDVDIYQARIKKDYFTESFTSIEIFTGLGAYKIIENYNRGDPEERELIKDYQQFLSYNFFNGDSVELIPKINSEVLWIKVGNWAEHPIYQLGDGLQTIIIATLPLFLNRNKKVLYVIEEPEKLLHPGFQRKLLETFIHDSRFDNCQFFITTHSNHLLDLSLDYSEISIFSVRKERSKGEVKNEIPTFLIENLSFGDRSALELLGVRNSSIYLSNCTIWIEGVTDRRYLRHYLELYFDEHSDSKKYLEDIHYSFLEYGGSNITHYSFLDNDEKPIHVERICGRLFLIADHDTGKEKRFEKLKENLGNRFYPLKCREIENLISKSVLLKIIQDYEKCVPDMKPFYESDYKNEPLGRFINEKLNKSNRSYQDDSGTVKNKPGFCQKAINYIKTWDDMSDEAQMISKMLYEFIESNNS